MLVLIGRADVAQGDSAAVLIADTWISTLDLDERGARLAVTIELRSRAARTVTARVDTILIDPHGHESGHLSQVLDIAPGVLAVTRKEIAVAHARTWSPANPVRYRAVTRVSVGGRAVDQVTTPFGVRTVRVAPGAGLVFNGAPLPVMGGALTRATLFGAVGGPAVEARRVTLLKEAGFNAVRVAGVVPDTFLEACDQLGLLVVMDLPGVADAGTGAGDIVQGWREAMRRGEAWLRQQRNRPSVIGWSVARGQLALPVLFREEMLGEWVARIHDLGPDLLVLGEIPAQGRSAVMPPWQAVEVSGETPLSRQREATAGGRAVFRFEARGTDPFVAWQRAREPGVAASFTPVEEDFSVTGERNSRSWYREVVWGSGEALRVAVRPRGGDPGFAGVAAWSGADGEGGRTIDVYSRYDAVRVFINERRVGEAPTLEAQAFRARFEAEFVPGVLRVVGVRRGEEVETIELPTPGAPRALRLQTQTPELRADGLDTAFVEVLLTDAAGQRVAEDRPIAVRRLSGGVEAELVGAAPEGARLERGRALILVRAPVNTGPARLGVTSPEVPEATIDLNVVPP